MTRSLAALGLAFFVQVFAAAPVAADAPVVLEVPSTSTRMEVTPELWARLPKTTVSAPATEHGPAATYSGVALRALLDESKVPSGKAVRGEYVGWVVVVEASDGYRATFALAELDASFTDQVVILADRCDGVPLDADHGPYRIIAPDEKRPGRWARNVIRLVVGAAQVAASPPR